MYGGGDGFRCGWVRCRLGVVVSQQAHHDSSSGGESDYMCIGEGDGFLVWVGTLLLGCRSVTAGTS